MKPGRRLWIFVVLTVLLILLPFPVASKLEERDSFCIACHTAPEEAYYTRAQATLTGDAPPQELGSAHYAIPDTPFRCIDCHRGDQSFDHRWQTFLLGARDGVIWITGQADPSIEKGHAGEPDLLNAACLSCHTDALLELGFNNHFHNQLLAARTLEARGLEPFEPPEGLPGTLFTELAEEPSSVTCLDCHQAHLTLPDGDLTLYIDVDGAMTDACILCHQEVGKGPQDL